MKKDKKKRDLITLPAKVAEVSEGRQIGLMLDEKDRGEVRRRMEKSLL